MSLIAHYNGLMINKLLGLDDGINKKIWNDNVEHAFNKMSINLTLEP